MLTFDEVVRLVGSRRKPLLAAIDGLPLSGKTTLALRLVSELGAECVQLDDFVKPVAEWPSRLH
jgi:uridine kinase